MYSNQTSRRALLAGAPAVAAAALAGGTVTNALAIAEAKAAEADPIYALIDLHRRLAGEASTLDGVVEDAEFSVAEGERRRPRFSHNWRDHSVFDTTVEFRRKAFLDPEYLEGAGATVEEIEEEYREIKAEIEAVNQAATDWDERHGIAPLRQQYEAARDARDEAENQLMKAKPTTPAGAAALIAYAVDDIWDDDPGGWALTAIKAVGGALAKMGAQS